jgi:hypothetical protein
MMPATAGSVTERDCGSCVTARPGSCLPVQASGSYGGVTNRAAGRLGGRGILGPFPGHPGRLPAAGAPPASMRPPWRQVMRGPVGSGSFPGHARRWGVARRAGRIAGFGPLRLRPDGDREGLRPVVRFDPLIHPVAITEHCIIGDQIRVPAAWCDMAGCGAGLADPAALGEADNRARAVAAGWAEDAWPGSLCPACQQCTRAAPAGRAFARKPDTTGDHQAPGGTGRPAGGAGQSIPSAAFRRPPAAGLGRHHQETPWPRLLGALASGRNGWTARTRWRISDTGTGPGQAYAPHNRQAVPAARSAGRHVRARRTAGSAGG